MRKPAKIRTVGTTSAILTLAALCGAATSALSTAAWAQDPSEVVNNQVQAGDVFSQGTLNVVTVEEGVTQSTSATGNSVQAYGDRTDMAVTSNQTLVGSVIAQTVVNVDANLGADSAISTTALGNTADV